MLAPNALTYPDATLSNKESGQGNASTLSRNISKDGSVLMSADGRIIKLNSAGSVIWEILYSSEKNGGLTEPELLTLLTHRFELSPQTLSPESVLNDLKQFLIALRDRRLISVSVDATGSSVFHIVKDTVWSGLKNRQYSNPQGHTVPRRINRVTSVGRHMTLGALCWLIAYSFLLRTGGFRTIARIVERRLPQPANSRDKQHEKEICLQICEAVDRAQSYLLRQALCLQRSIVITRLLQNRGICAETVIAAHLMPFKSHAWVEVDGEVVSDTPNVQRYYDVVVERLGGPRMKRGEDR
jgi:Transglutaminase-like superfamily/Coenzyme PQQ synthesis protein D (PqqD)